MVFSLNSRAALGRVLYFEKTAVRIRIANPQQARFFRLSICGGTLDGENQFILAFFKVS